MLSSTNKSVVVAAPINTSTSLTQFRRFLQKWVQKKGWDSGLGLLKTFWPSACTYPAFKQQTVSLRVVYALTITFHVHSTS